MKKILIIVLFFIITKPFYSQVFTESIDTTRETLTSLYGSSVYSMTQIFKRYNVAVLCDSTMKVGTDADMTEYVTTKAGQWNFLGSFYSDSFPNLWFRKANAETTAVTPSFVIWEAK